MVKSFDVKSSLCSFAFDLQRRCHDGWTVDVIAHILRNIPNIEVKSEVKSGCDANDDGIPSKTKVLGILPNEL